MCCFHIHHILLSSSVLEKYLQSISYQHLNCWNIATSFWVNFFFLFSFQATVNDYGFKYTDLLLTEIGTDNLCKTQTFMCLKNFQLRAFWENTQKCSHVTEIHLSDIQLKKCFPDCNDLLQL